MDIYVPDVPPLFYFERLFANPEEIELPPGTYDVRIQYCPADAGRGCPVEVWIRGVVIEGGETTAIEHDFAEDDG
jgi:hypothetical protein